MAENSDEPQKPWIEALWFALFVSVFLSMALALPYFWLTGLIDTSKRWFDAPVLVGGWLVAVHYVIKLVLTYRNRRLPLSDVEAKADAGATRFWFTLIRIGFTVAAAVGVWLFFGEVFLPASSTNKLLAVLCIVLAGIFLALIRISHQLGRRR